MKICFQAQDSISKLEALRGKRQKHSQRGGRNTGIISKQGHPENHPPVLNLHMLKVSLELPSNKYMWPKSRKNMDISSLLLPT